MMPRNTPQASGLTLALADTANPQAAAISHPSPGHAPWNLSDLIKPLENLISALPQPKSLFPSRAATVRPCILVVDDDDFNFDLLEDALESDYEVLYARDGVTALEIATQRIPDLILLDVVMPGLDGYEVCRRLKAQHKTGDIPVIFISGLGSMSAETTGLALGAVDYIMKPINTTAVRVKASNQIQFKWALDSLILAASMEKELRDDLLAALELKSRDQRIR